MQGERELTDLVQTMRGVIKPITESTPTSKLNATAIMRYSSTLLKPGLLAALRAREEIDVKRSFRKPLSASEGNKLWPSVSAYPVFGNCAKVPLLA